jgi:hypothetical protein
MSVDRAAISGGDALFKSTLLSTLLDRIVHPVFKSMGLDRIVHPVVVRPTATRIRVHPHPGIRLLQGLVVLLVIASFFLLPWKRDPSNIVEGLICVGLILLVWGVNRFAAYPFVEVDRDNHLLLFRGNYDREKLPLAAVLVVDMVQSLDEKTYRVNLIVDNTTRPLLCLTNQRGLKWSREFAGQLAELLQVPLVDHVAADK